jgi:hypothetical protein
MWNSIFHCCTKYYEGGLEYAEAETAVIRSFPDGRQHTSVIHTADSSISGQTSAPPRARTPRQQVSWSGHGESLRGHYSVKDNLILWPKWQIVALTQHPFEDTIFGSLLRKHFWIRRQSETQRWDSLNGQFEDLERSARPLRFVACVVVNLRLSKSSGRLIFMQATAN